jgi:putative OPT family oligopeptide transporter
MPRNNAPQLTLRAVTLGIVLAALMAAANTYLGLFAGMTVASAIPSAVVSMAVLKLLGGGGILENNIVQTGGSAGSSVATGVLFTTPALVMLGAWHEYRYAWVFAFAALGGVLGVLFSVPLRRALIVDQKLPFPEGTAAAEVLRAGADPRHGARLLALAAGAGALLKLAAANGLQLVPDTATAARYVGRGIAYMTLSVSPALLGVGYICGFNVGVVMLAGGMICWNIAIPIYSSFFLSDNAALAARISGL